MTLDDLKDHLDRRLDQQDRERKALAGQVGNLRVDVALIKKDVGAQGAACEARHGSNRKRINRIEGGFIALGAAAVFACWEFAKRKVTGSGG